jgi:probable rRNA maturation factor
MANTRQAGAQRRERPRPERRPGSNARPFSLEIHPHNSPHVPFLRRHLRAARRLIDSTLRDLHIILAPDRTMARLHEQFLGLAGPTDVITFPIDLDAKGRPLSGEIYVGVPHARRQAAARSIPLRKELLLYALHGMLHLSGHDDRTQRDFARMHTTEDQLLSQIGIGKVFVPTRPQIRSSSRPSRRSTELVEVFRVKKPRPGGRS